MLVKLEWGKQIIKLDFKIDLMCSQNEKDE